MEPPPGGEKVTMILVACTMLGSPPRGRGKGRGQALVVAGAGITPAQAGKSKLALCTPSCPTDHPRMSGEKKLKIELLQPHAGSPPRRRGKACTARRRAALHGITPAWAGKRVQGMQRALLCMDHPRMGGEKVNKKKRLVRVKGLPPRGRGKAAVGRFVHPQQGITPA